MTDRVTVRDATFVGAAPRPAALVPSSLPEAAFAGRSNVGKSSLVARLLGRKSGLVRVSRRPGRTQSINFFDVETNLGPGRLVDLPGYGYAEAPRRVRDAWGPLVTGYLRDRESLCLVVVLLDARHEPTELDLALLEMLRDFGRPAVTVATKADKLAKSKVKPAVLRIAEATGTRVLPFSARTGHGTEALWTVVGRACGIL